MVSEIAKLELASRKSTLCGHLSDTGRRGSLGDSSWKHWGVAVFSSYSRALRPQGEAPPETCRRSSRAEAGPGLSLGAARKPDLGPPHKPAGLSGAGLCGQVNPVVGFAQRAVWIRGKGAKAARLATEDNAGKFRRKSASSQDLTERQKRGKQPVEVHCVMFPRPWMCEPETRQDWPSGGKVRAGLFNTTAGCSGNSVSFPCER